MQPPVAVDDEEVLAVEEEEFTEVVLDVGSVVVAVCRGSSC